MGYWYWPLSNLIIHYKVDSGVGHEKERCRSAIPERENTLFLGNSLHSAKEALVRLLASVNVLSLDISGTILKIQQVVDERTRR